MLRPGLPENESERLAVLRGLGVLDTPADQGFDDLTALAAAVCEVPIAVVSLVDAERQWFKSKVGLCVGETDRDVAFCAHAVAANEELYIPDAASDLRTHDNPLVTGDLHVRFYCGVPLRSEEGLPLGTLCAIDTRPRDLSPAQREMLRRLARQAETQLKLLRNQRALELRTREAERLAAELKLAADGSDRIAKTLRAATETLRRTGSLARVGGWEYDVETRELHWSPEVYAIHELPVGEAMTVERSVRFYVPEAREEMEAAMERAVRDGANWDLELEMVTARGREIWVRAQGEAVLHEGLVLQVVGALQEITDRRRAQDELRRAATHDVLTGLPNRAMLCEALERAARRASAGRRPFSLLFVDFDRFKWVNDNLGHHAGDELLKAIAARLRGAVRVFDVGRDDRGDHESVAARLGGDEFVVLIDGVGDEAVACGIAQRLVEVFAQPYGIAGHSVTSTASIGVVTSGASCAGAESVLRDADAAMYQAKLAGKGRYAVFSPAGASSTAAA